MAPKKENGTPKAGSSEESEGSKCPMDAVFYVVAFSLLCTYGVYVYDKPAFEAYSEQYPFLSPVITFFEKVEQYSPFIEFLDDDDWAQDKSKEKPKPQADEDVVLGDKIFTAEELAKYDGSNGDKILLALLGQVFDVSKAPKYYGKDGGYGFFSGKDASRAFVSGEFGEEGLTDDVTGLSGQDYLGLQEWLGFYHKDYTYVGKLVGRYFNEDGSATKYFNDVQGWILKAKEEDASNRNERKIFPPCNSEWSAEKGQRVWCTTKSGGIDRNWVGVPRRLFLPGKAERCACIKDSGESLYNPGAKNNNDGDLDNPHLKLYAQCSDDLKATSCQISPGGSDD